MLRRSTRNAGKKAEVPAADMTASKKRGASTSKAKSATAKKAKTVADRVSEVVSPATEPKEQTTVGEKGSGLQEGDALPDDLPDIQTHSAEDTTLLALLATAEKGIIIFAYPKASTPGCTKQACFFRDSFDTFQAAGYAVYGLSGDGPGANEKFKNKQNLQYTLLCDPTYALHDKLQIKKHPKGTIRSVIVIEKVDGGGRIVRKASATPDASVKIAKDALSSLEEPSSVAEKATGDVSSNEAPLKDA